MMLNCDWLKAGCPRC